MNIKKNALALFLPFFCSQYVSLSSRINAVKEGTCFADSAIDDSLPENETPISADFSDGVSKSHVVRLKYNVLPESKVYFESNNVLIQNHFEQDGKYYVDVSVPHKEGQLIARSDKGNIVDTYLYKDNLGQTYFSSISLDSAKKSSGIDSSLLYSGLGGMGGGITIIPINPIKNKKKFHCSFYWKDIKGTVFPLVGAKINLKTNSGLSFVGTTDEAGSSTFDFSGVTIVGSGAPDLTSAWNEISNNEYSLKLILENDLIQVDDNSGLVYSAQFSADSVQDDGDSKNLEWTFEPYSAVTGFSSDFGRAVEIFQSRYYYSKHAFDLAGKKATKISQCKVKFPIKGNNDWYNSDSETIFIGDSEGNNKSMKSFESWDAFGHEYGHHLEKMFNISQRTGESHNAGMDDAMQIIERSLNKKSGLPTVTFGYAKERGRKTAWSESWPTFWATMAQDSFPQALKNETYLGIGDDKYYAGNFAIDSQTGSPTFRSYNTAPDSNGMVSPIGGIKLGQANDCCELAIIRFLYQLYDSENDDIDVFSIKEQELWNDIIDLADYYNDISEGVNNKKLCYFYQVLQELEGFCGNDKILRLAERYQVCPDSHFVINNNRITWKTYIVPKFKPNSNILIEADDISNLSFSRNLCPNHFMIYVAQDSEGTSRKCLNSGNVAVPGLINNGEKYQYAFSSKDLATIKSYGNSLYRSVRAFYDPETKQDYDFLGGIDSRWVKVSV